MAQGRKYAALPDLDSAPDVYETQEPAEDAKSTRSDRSSSAASSYQDLDQGSDEEDAAASGVDKAQLQPGQARSQFKSSRVDARKVDFSDRVGGRRRSYKVGSRRRRTEFEGNGAADDDDDETYQEKLARLRREVEELEALGRDNKTEATTEDTDVVAGLTRTLRDLEVPLRQTPGIEPAQDDEKAQEQPRTSAESLAQLHIPDQAATERALALASALGTRLASLESALGLPLLALPSANPAEGTTSASEKPVFATLAALDRQLATLNSSTAPSLAALASQIDSLTASAEALAGARKAAAAARKDLRSTAGAASRPISSHSFSTSRPSSYSRPRGSGSAGDNAPGGADGDEPLSEAAAVLLAGEESEQAARISKLYAQLPTLEALAPLVPRLVDRLASLKALHAAAGGAGESLDAVERGQARLAADLGEWRAALAEMEARVAEAARGESSNRDVVQGWISELEARMDKVGGAA